MGSLPEVRRTSTRQIATKRRPGKYGRKRDCAVRRRDTVVLFFQNELAANGQEVIALKSQVRDLLQKLESKERRYRDERGTTDRPEKCDDDADDDDDVDNLRDDRLTTTTADDDDLCSLVERLNEQVRISDGINRYSLVNRSFESIPIKKKRLIYKRIGNKRSIF